MRAADFDYDLPEELIAQQAAPRGESRLLAMDRGALLTEAERAALGRRASPQGVLV